jgi:IgA Peptidase M64
MHQRRAVMFGIVVGAIGCSADAIDEKPVRVMQAGGNAGSAGPTAGAGGSMPGAGGAVVGGGMGGDAIGAGGMGGGVIGTPKRICQNQPASPVDCGATCTPVRANGPPSNRVSLVLIGEGFTQTEISGFYAPHSETLAKYMFENANDSEPYVRYKRYINFYRIDLVSKESGIDDPKSGHYVDTPLDGETGCTDLPGQMCTVRWSKALDAFDAALRGSDVGHIDWRWITLNFQQGCGVTHYPARGNLSIYCPYQDESPDIALHEGGHGFDLLADTYWTIDQDFTGPEPSNVNLTKDPTGAKWKRWLGYEDPTLGVVGAFEGGGQYTRGLYRPSLNQKMGSKVRCHPPGPPYCPHDAVSREKIILDIYKIVRPLDGWSKNDSVLVNPDKLTVDVVDCDVVKVDWYMDDTLVAADFGEEFGLGGLARGRHTVEARAHDDTEWVRLARTNMEQKVTWQVDIQ